MIFSCSQCASFLNDKDTLERSVQGKEQWQCNKKRYKCRDVKKQKKRCYVARDERCEILDNSSDEEPKQETVTHQDVLLVGKRSSGKGSKRSNRDSNRD
jgi:hypothetical protein